MFNRVAILPSDMPYFLRIVILSETKDLSQAQTPRIDRLCPSVMPNSR